MAITKAARNIILSLVQVAKKRLMTDVEEQLQQFYGIRPDGVVHEYLTADDPSVQHTAHLLRQRLHYLRSNLPAAHPSRDTEGVRQLIREQAFTILNRFASLRMAEERGIMPESISQKYESNGFQAFDAVTGEAKTAPIFTRYRWYIAAVFDE